MEATSEEEVVAAVRAYLERLSPIARSAFPAGTPPTVRSGDDVAELALALSRERTGKFGNPWAGVTLQPVEAFLARACVRLAQLEGPRRKQVPARARARAGG
jgi:hypothetical protein